LEYKLREDFNYPPSIVAIFYTIQFIGYLCISPFCHRFLEKYNGTLLTLLSCYVIGFSSFLIGPSDLFKEWLPNDIKIMIAGLLFTGLATSFTTIGTY
jgi:hypothetical protein